MLKNYFLIAIRSFKKDKTNALISLSGLIVGLGCVMLIVGYIRYETSFDTSYSNSERIYRVISIQKENWGTEKSESVPEALGLTFVREIPGIVAQTPIHIWNENVLNKKESNEVKYCRVSNNFFSIFDFKAVQGNLKTALKSVDDIVLTVSTAKKLYGTIDVIGREFITKKKTYIVSGVVQDMPQNTFLQTDIFYLDTLRDKLSGLSSKDWYSKNCFILLKENASVNIVKNKIKQLCARYNVMLNEGIELQPVSKIYLHSSDIQTEGAAYRLGDLKYIYIYACIALLILIIGCINFINLTIARSLERTKEVGVRKVFGAQKKQLIWQFIGESSLYFAVAIPLALLLAGIFWNKFTVLLNIEAGISFLLNIKTILIIAGICIFSTLLSGFYPAFFLSGLRPVNSLKGGRINGLSVNMGIRKLLIIVQFTISIALIVATIVVHTQLHYLNDAPLGFDKNNLLAFDVPSNENNQAFKDRLGQNPNIQSFTFSGLHIANYYGATSSMDNPQDSTKQLNFAFIGADFDFLKTFQIPIVEGRNFSVNYPSDLIDYNALEDAEAKKNEIRKKNHQPVVNFLATIEAKRPVIVSENLAKVIGLKNPVGQSVCMGAFQGTIIGIIKDFKGLSLKEKNPFIVIRCYPTGFNAGQAYARINSTNTNATINFIAKAFKQYFPNDRFDFSFVDDRIAHLYDNEIRLTRLFNIFAFLAIALSCMGLFSLVSLMVRKKTKEIGIRKVMGASVKDIVVLVSKDFIWLIVISFIIATPLAYIAMNKWLNEYANKIKMYWWIFAIAGIVAFIIALVSIGFKSVAAAKANPVDSLKNE